MNNLLAVYFTLSIITFNLYAQDVPLYDEDSAAAIPLIAYWNLNECHTFEVTRQNIEYEDDVLKDSLVSATIYRITVLDSTAHAYRMEWIPLKYHSNRQENIPDHTEQAIMDLLSEMRLIYSTDELGIFNRLENADSIITRLRAIMNTRLSEVQNPDSIKFVEELVRVFGSDTFLREKLSEEIRLFHLIHGYEYPLDTIMEYEDVFPNLLGGDPITAKGTAEIVDVDTTNFTFTYVDVLEPDSEAVRNFLFSFFRKLGISDDAEIEQNLTSFPIQLEDTKTYIADYIKGWIFFMEFNREVQFGSIMKKNVVRIELIE